MSFLVEQWRRLLSVGKMILALVIAAGIFTYPLKRRERFGGRLCFTLVVLTVFSLAFWMNFNTQYYLVESILWYFSMLVLCIIGICFCFRCSRHTALVLGASAAASQHLYRDVVQIIESWGYTSERIGELWYNLYGFIVMAGVYFVIFWLFGRHVKDYPDEPDAPKRQQLIAVLMILFIGTFSKLSTYGEGITMQTKQFFYIYDIVGLMFCFAMLYELLNSSRLEMEKERTQQALYAKNQYYNISRENIELINIKCHDMRHQLSALSGGSAGLRNYQEQVEQVINVYDNTFRTGNEALDVVLTEKSLLCSQNDIQISCIVDGHALSFMEGVDIYALFGNILDNAIESVKALPTDQKLIDLSVSARGTMVVVQAMNGYTGELTFRDGLPVTTKTDQGYHGFGLKSIRMIAEKYNGTMKVEAKDGYFTVSLLLSPN